MKKISLSLILIILSLVAVSQKKYKNIEYAKDILDMKEIQIFLSLSETEDRKPIRIFDMSDFFENEGKTLYFNSNGQKPLNVIVYKNYYRDLNTGKFRDLIIDGGGEEKGLKNLSFYLVPFKCMGDEKIPIHFRIFFRIVNGKFIMESKEMAEE